MLIQCSSGNKSIQVISIGKIAQKMAQTIFENIRKTSFSLSEIML
jgi:hypothetical protein